MQRQLTPFNASEWDIRISNRDAVVTATDGHRVALVRVDVVSQFRGHTVGFESFRAFDGKYVSEAM